MNRTRRLRTNSNIRNLVRENEVRIHDLVYPIFIEEGENIKKEIPSMPGIFRFSIDHLKAELDEVVELGIQAVLLFGIPIEKDEIGAETWNDDGVIQNGIRFIKKHYPNLFVITDVCFCEYTTHGHCGVLCGTEVDNDKTLINLEKQAISHAKAGADMVAPSGMMDGAVQVIRKALDGADYKNVSIMGYTVKYCSSFYGPFRDAADSAPSFGDRKQYQMDPANRIEGMLESTYDQMEGADILMVKPALAYLDIIRDLKNSTDLPVACYNVSGEYAMVKAAAEKGWIDGEAVMMESLLAMKRAGAKIIITYFAKQAAILINKK
ncbi:porphobilinogen synthase [Putridiphycobacter roseus]|uniref:porphobilinogen synthase n=1 Tax=Putridiphycobacter roseus TaxID=2219161 RepID=UPI0036388913